MKGATTLPWVKSSNDPNVSMAIRMGSSQYFLRTRKNIQNSRKKVSIGVSFQNWFDMLSGAGNTHIATLVERTSRFVMLVKLENKTTDAVIAALTHQIQQLPQELKRSLTWDRGLEMAKHKQFTVDTGVQVYFCDPQSPWQRGTNENTNGLLRQYFPKRSEIRHFTQAGLDAVAAQLNGRPRQTLGFKTPSQALDEALR